MIITPIDLAHYSRAEHFRHYIKHECAISITADVDITILWKYVKSHQLRLYPTLLWVVSKAVNTIPECRLTLDNNGNLAIFDQINPAYVAWNPDKESIYCLTTPFNNDFNFFYQNCLNDMEIYRGDSMFPQELKERNVFSISASSELQFTSVTISVHKQPLNPIIAMGKVFKKRNKYYMPLAVQVHHAVCDMHHITLIHKEIQSVIMENFLE